MNRMNNLLIGLFLITSTTYFFSQYQALKKENLTLQLKLKLNSPQKKVAVSWMSLKNNKDLSQPKKVSKKIASLKTRKNNKRPTEKDDFDPIQELETDLLVEKVQKSLNKHWKLNRKKIEQTLALVDELILRNPDVYSSYKAKLILLLTKENKYDETMDERDLNDLLMTMSDFDTVSEKTMRKEAFLIAQTNTQIDNILLQMDNLEQEMSRVDDKIRIDQLNREMDIKMSELTDLEDQLEEGLLSDADYINEDLLEIPLYRSLAKKDYTTVIESSERLLDKFPQSLSAHFFLIRALQLSGAKDEALSFMKNIQLAPAKIKLLNQRLQSSSKQKAKNYWKRLRF